MARVEGRIVGVLIGWSAQVLFHALLPFLMWFCWSGASAGADAATSAGTWAVVAGDVALLIGAFVVPHSLLLVPQVRRWLARIIPAACIPSLFCLSAVFGLAAIFLAWQPVPGAALWWAADGELGPWLVAAAVAWAFLGWAILGAGAGWQTGFTPFWAWLRGRPAPQRVLPRAGCYRWFRHPIYAGFALVAWATPYMDRGRLVLAIVFTLYCLLGSWAKDRRLIRTIGEPYRAWCRSLPGWPWGWLLRWLRPARALSRAVPAGPGSHAGR